MWRYDWTISSLEEFSFQYQLNSLIKISTLSQSSVKMLGELPLYGPPPFPCMVAKATVRSTIDMDGEPYWPVPKGSCGRGACSVAAGGMLACFIVMFISGRLTMMSLCGELMWLVISAKDCGGAGGNSGGRTNAIVLVFRLVVYLGT
jgi:hypothetical protein